MTCFRRTSHAERRAVPRDHLKTVNVIARSAATKQSQSYEWEIASLSLPHSAIAQSPL